MIGTSDPAARHRRLIIVARAVSCALVTLVIAACGARGNPPDITPTVAPVDFSWNLPVIDTAADGVDGEIYQALLKSCDDGDRMIAQKWRESASPRNVLLFAAGVQACKGDLNAARTLYVRARDEFGLAGLGPAQDSARCDLYKSVVSAVERAPRDRFPCMDGVSPAFTRAADGTVDDPLTPVDESAAVAVSTAPTSTATTAPTRAPQRATPTRRPLAPATRAPARPPPGDDARSRSDDTDDRSDARSDDGSDDDSDDEDTGDDVNMNPSEPEPEPDMSENGGDTPPVEMP